MGIGRFVGVCFGLWKVGLVGYRLEGLCDERLGLGGEEVLELFGEQGLQLGFRSFVFEQREDVVGEHLWVGIADGAELRSEPGFEVVGVRVVEQHVR